ncbi:hypothetical protein HBZC1_18220 [Helicobacter bizzozeronii CIII-1]|uniref:Uncharacterized protein n=1 Tax=Helicobacter bizzozeronii (strain CIII-1) TaxID=1002804 RepID=F8KPR9_HELBC|nr:hypothetical protein HBZC1_18220 [Helicobacter bizzozeronii CIII-1]
MMLSVPKSCNLILQALGVMGAPNMGRFSVEHLGKLMC